jgi:hypothetical protein
MNEFAIFFVVGARALLSGSAAKADNSAMAKAKSGFTTVNGFQFAWSPLSFLRLSQQSPVLQQ